MDQIRPDIPDISLSRMIINYKTIEIRYVSMCFVCVNRLYL